MDDNKREEKMVDNGTNQFETILKELKQYYVAQFESIQRSQKTTLSMLSSASLILSILATIAITTGQICNPSCGRGTNLSIFFFLALVIATVFGKWPRQVHTPIKMTSDNLEKYQKFDTIEFRVNVVNQYIKAIEKNRRGERVIGRAALVSVICLAGIVLSLSYDFLIFFK